MLLTAFRPRRALLGRFFSSIGVGNYRYEFSFSNDEIKPIAPFFSQIAAFRGKDLDGMTVHAANLIDPEETKDPSLPRSPDFSSLQLIFKFSTFPQLRDRFLKVDLKTIRYGLIFEALDAFCADIAARHCQPDNPRRPLALVTASVQDMHFSAPLDADHDLVLNGHVEWIGRSSMDIKVLLFMCPSSSSSTLDISQARQVGSVSFIFVAREPDKFVAAPLNPLLLETDEQRTLFDRAGKALALRRKQDKEYDLARRPPTVSELGLIHSLYIEGLKQEEASSHISRRRGGEKKEEQGASSQSLDKRGGGFSLENAMAMSETEFRSTIYMHRQMRNIHGKVFGGYMMREGFEIAFIVASLFSKQAWPVFKGISDVDFIKPTPIGSIVQFRSWVLFSDPKSGLFYVQVDAEVIHNNNDPTPFSGKRSVQQAGLSSSSSSEEGRVFKERSTSFVFEFQQAQAMLPEEGFVDEVSAASVDLYGEDAEGGKVPSILPREYGQFMDYIRGRRIFDMRTRTEKKEEE